MAINNVIHRIGFAVKQYSRTEPDAPILMLASTKVKASTDKLCSETIE
jgi:hypothetical protein